MITPPAIPFVFTLNCLTALDGVYCPKDRMEFSCSTSLEKHPWSRVVHHIETKVYIEMNMFNNSKVYAIPHRKNNNTAVSDARPQPASQPEMPLSSLSGIRQLGSPIKVSSPQRHHNHCRPTTASLSIACVRAQAAAGLAQCDAHGYAALRCADAPKGLPAALCVAPRGPARQPSIALLSSPSVSLLPLLFFPLPSTRQTLSLPPIQHPHTPQCLPAAPARERTRRRSSSSFPRTAKPRARRSKSFPIIYYIASFLRLPNRAVPGACDDQMLARAQLDPARRI